MAWQDEMIPMLRVMLGDLDEDNETYSDDTLEQTLLLAAKQVSATLTFDQTFVSNMSALTLSPDPTAGADKNDSYVNLVTLKAAAVLDRTEASLAARRGIIVKDGSSSIDLSKVSQAKLRLLEKGWNAVYDDAKFEYQMQRSQSVAGAAVMTPFRLYAWEAFGASTLSSPRDRDVFII